MPRLLSSTCPQSALSWFKVEHAHTFTDILPQSNAVPHGNPVYSRWSNPTPNLTEILQVLCLTLYRPLDGRKRGLIISPHASEAIRGLELQHATMWRVDLTLGLRHRTRQALDLYFIREEPSGTIAEGEGRRKEEWKIGRNRECNSRGSGHLKSTLNSWKTHDRLLKLYVLSVWCICNIGLPSVK